MAQAKSTITCDLAATGMFALLLCAFAVRANAQSIENGTGVVCDSATHVEQFIALRGDSKSAVEQINTESKSRVCEILHIAFLVGGIVADASNDKGTWQIRKILVVGIYLGRVINSVPPYEKYTAFLTSKTSPI
jgi:hypothetical protein